MREFKQTMKTVCDCCGKEETVLDTEVPFKNESNYTVISIFVKDNNHRIDLCPECAKFVLDYLKENCNDSANWPEDL